jgi:hypothetical protein
MVLSFLQGRPLILSLMGHLDGLPDTDLLKDGKGSIFGRMQLRYLTINGGGYNDGLMAAPFLGMLPRSGHIGINILTIIIGGCKFSNHPQMQCRIADAGRCAYHRLASAE